MYRDILMEDTLHLKVNGNIIVTVVKWDGPRIYISLNDQITTKVNDHCIDITEKAASKHEQKPLEVTIKVPKNIDKLESLLRGNSSLLSKEVNFTSIDLLVKNSASANISCTLVRPTLNVVAQNNAKVIIASNISRASLFAMGFSTIETKGACTGHYGVIANKLGAVSHHGTIAGVIEKQLKDSATMKIIH